MAVPKKNRFNLDKLQTKFITKKLGVTNILDVDTVILKRLKEELKSITDKRPKNKITYKIWDVIICIIIANFSSVYDWEEIHDFVIEHYDWFRKFLQMTGGVPSAQTYERILSIVDHKELENLLVSFF